MKLVRSLAVSAALAGALVTGACATVHHHHEPQYVQTYDVVCDPHEYAIHDYHCGYTDHGHWVYFGWVHVGTVSRAPSNWTPPASVRSRYTTKSVPNPKYTPKKSKPRVVNPNAPKSNNNVVPKSNTNTKKVTNSNPYYKKPVSRTK